MIKTKKRIKITFVSCSLILVLLVQSFSVFISDQKKVEAAGASYAFAYPHNNDSINEIEAAVGDKDADKQSALESTKAYAKGGFWSKLSKKPIELRYEKNITRDSQFDDYYGVEDDGNDDDDFFYSVLYRCWDQGKKVAFGTNPAPGNVSYYQISLLLRIDLDSGDGTFEKEQQYNGQWVVNSIGLYHPKSTGGSRDYETVAQGLAQAGGGSTGDIPKSPPWLAQRRTMDFQPGCLPYSPISDLGSGGLGSVTVDNYAFKKDDWKDIKTSAEQVQNGNVNPDDDTTADCDTKLTNPLSWILCPIVDIGSSASDYVFNSILEPLLSDIPLDDKSFFKAWQGFRFIANVVLIGGMLGIVYSMARGDR